MTSDARLEMEAALKAIDSMIARGEKAQAKFAPGTAQHTLQRNRLHALSIASALMARELAGDEGAANIPMDDLERAAAPIASLISKSEKALQKLAQGTWQHAMLAENLKALHMASPLLDKALSGNNMEKA